MQSYQKVCRLHPKKMCRRSNLCKKNWPFLGEEKVRVGENWMWYGIARFIHFGVNISTNVTYLHKDEEVL